MRHAIAALAGILIATGNGAAFAQESTASASQEQPVATNRAQPREFMLAMRDEVELAADVYLPEGDGPFPTVLIRTPYGKQNLFASSGGQALVDNGYAVVVQDVRGKGNSKGYYAAFVNDIEDGYDTVEGVAAMPWSNGRIGMTGASAMGITTTLAAIGRPPHLEAGFVIVAPNESFRTSFIGGVPKDRDTIGWLTRQGVSPEVVDRAIQANVRSVFTERAGPGPLITYADIPIWHVGGWYDIFNTGTVENFVRLQHEGTGEARGNQRLTMGPFGHGELSGDLAYPGADDLRATMTGEGGDLMRWFDHWLKDIDNGVTDEAPVEVYMMGAARKGALSDRNRWIEAGDWPLAYRSVRYYLGKDRTLSRDRPADRNAAITYRFDPENPVQTYGGANLVFERGPQDQRQVGERQDYLRFQTAPLEEDVAIAGPVTAELWVSTDGPDTDFEAKLIDVYPDGYEALLLDAPIRTRFRNGFMPDEVAMMEPGAPVKVTIDMWPIAQTFEKGHRIALHVTSSNSPRFTVNNNNGATPASSGEPRVARNTIHLDEGHPSALVLPVVYLDD